MEPEQKDEPIALVAKRIPCLVTLAPETRWLLELYGGRLPFIPSDDSEEDDAD